MSIERLTSEGKGQLDANHYLGSKGARSRFTYTDEHGIIVFAAPSSRRIPTTWIELSRWCIERGGQGSQQWSKAIKWLQERAPDATTVVSYSDPSVGHTGALYRACGWLWAPTWHAVYVHMNAATETVTITAAEVQVGDRIVKGTAVRTVTSAQTIKSQLNSDRIWLTFDLNAEARRTQQWVKERFYSWERVTVQRTCAA
jgi:hypothetical protein